MKSRISLRVGGERRTKTRWAEKKVSFIRQKGVVGLMRQGPLFKRGSPRNISTRYFGGVLDKIHKYSFVYRSTVNHNRFH